MPQTSYSQDHVAAIAGQLVDRGDGSKARGRYECSESIGFGLIPELHTDGKLRLPQTAGAVGKLMGGVAYNASLPPRDDGSYGYQAGDFQVPVQRRCSMWIQYTGTAPGVETQAKVSSSSTVATNRGKVTGDAANATAGTEIYAMPGTNVIKVDTATGLALVEFNLPA